MRFISIRKAAEKYNATYIQTRYGAYGAMGLDSKMCRKLRIWAGVNEDNELKTSANLIDCGNYWLDKLADDLSNGRVKVADIAEQEI